MPPAPSTPPLPTASFCRLTYCKLGLAVLSGHAANAARQVLAAQRLDVLDLKALDVQVIKALHDSAD